MLRKFSNDNTVKFWNLTDGKEILTLKGHSAGVKSVSFSLNGRMLASASDDTIRLWNFNLDDLLRRGCKWLQHTATIYISKKKTGACVMIYCLKLDLSSSELVPSVMTGTMTTTKPCTGIGKRRMRGMLKGKFLSPGCSHISCQFILSSSFSPSRSELYFYCFILLIPDKDS